jgi:hypothetical protein
VSAAARKRVTVGLVRARCHPKPEADLERAIARIREAANPGAQVVGMLGVSTHPYPCDSEGAGGLPER